jgi:hypothetical protein
MGVSLGGRDDDDDGIGREVVLWGLANLIAGRTALAREVMLPAEMTKPQMQQNPLLAGFVLLRIWWAGVI